MEDLRSFHDALVVFHVSSPPVPHEQYLRLFLAIDPPDVVRQGLQRAQNRVKPLFNTGTYPKPENLHVTLHFLGDTPVSRLPALIEAFSKVAMPVLTLRTGRLLYFPDERRARVAAMGLEGDVALLAGMYDQLTPVVSNLGYRLDHRRYTPHITIARFKIPPHGEGLDRAISAADSATQSLEPFRVHQFTLYQSTLDPKGPKYAPLGRFPR